MKDFMMKRLTVELEFLKRQLFTVQTQKALYEKEEMVLNEQIEILKKSLECFKEKEDNIDPFSF